MLTIPTWLFILSLIVAGFLSFIAGVLRCYNKTLRIGDIIVTKEEPGNDIYLFLELKEPIQILEPELQDGKEVLATLRVKNM